MTTIASHGVRLQQTHVVCVFLLFLLSSLLVASSSSSDTAAPVTPSFLSTLDGHNFHSLHIEQTYPHDPTHFTQGFAIDNEPTLSTRDVVIEFYEGTGIWGGTFLHKYTLPLGGGGGGLGGGAGEAGKSLQLQASVKVSNSIFGEGVCVLNHETILQLTWQNQQYHLFPKRTFGSKSSFNNVVKPLLAQPSQDYKTIPYPRQGGHGLAGWQEGWSLTQTNSTRRMGVGTFTIRGSQQ